MMPPTATASMDSDERLLEVARLLAEGILRSRLRRFLKRNATLGTREIPLELCASSSAHACETSRNGEHA